MYNRSSNLIKEKKGTKILTKGEIKKHKDGHYAVKSQSTKDTFYDVIWEKNHWTCSCMDYTKNKSKCKHVHAVIYFQTLAKIKSSIEYPYSEKNCPKCGLADQAVKDGMRYNRSGPVQRYLCKRCKKRYSERITGFKGMRNKAEIVASALDLFYRGLSLRQIAHHLKMSHRVDVCHGTVYYWIKKYIELITPYTRGLTASFTGRLLADETILRVNGRHLLLWSLLDAQTRYLVAVHVSQKRGEDEATVLLKKGKKISKNNPSEIVSDGLISYNGAIKKEYGSDPEKPIIHLQGPLTLGLNNKIERFNGSIKSRTKTMAGLYSKETTTRFVDGFSSYYNFIRDHKALNGMTPAMMAGITTEHYTWLDLIIKSAKAIGKTDE